MSGLVVRQLRHADFDEFFSVFTSAFLVDVRERMREAYRAVFEPERSLGVFDGSEMVGVGGSLRPEITLPGGGSLPLAAVTWVGVRPDQRRRGVLTSLMRAQLEGLRAHEPVAALYSTEGSIYGRFGYGLGTYDALFSHPHSPRRCRPRHRTRPRCAAADLPGIRHRARTALRAELLRDPDLAIPELTNTTSAA